MELGIIMLYILVFLFLLGGYVYFWMEDIFGNRLKAWLASTMLMYGFVLVIYIFDCYT